MFLTNEINWDVGVSSVFSGGVYFCPHPTPDTFVLRWNFLITSFVLMSECYPSSFVLMHESFTYICPHILKPHQVNMSSPPKFSYLRMYS